jgi:hypothetical protein
MKASERGEGRGICQEDREGESKAKTYEENSQDQTTQVSVFRQSRDQQPKRNHRGNQRSYLRPKCRHPK